MKLQLLLHPHARNQESKESVRRISESLGIHVTTEGAISMSANIDDRQFPSLFGKATESNAASLTAPPLPVPHQLSEFVETISVPPTHIYMGPKSM